MRDPSQQRLCLQHLTLFFLLGYGLRLHLRCGHAHHTLSHVVGLTLIFVPCATNTQLGLQVLRCATGETFLATGGALAIHPCAFATGTGAL
jgi:hypothetical protein